VDTQQELKRKAAELANLVSRCGLTYAPLAADLTFAIKEWQRDKQSQFWSRTAIRCLCACVEATLFSFRKMAEEMGSLSKIKFEPDEIAILSETQIRDGVQKPKWLSPADSVKESFRLFGKSVGCPVVIDYGHTGFGDLREIFKIRNRLMHPKGPFDVQVTVADINTADRAIVWFNKAFTGAIDQCRAQTNNNIANLRRRPG
jgi:hypothetical protein